MRKNENSVINFENLRVTTTEFDRGNLPDGIDEIVHSPEDLQNLYDLSLANWNTAFDRESLLGELRNFLETDPKERTKKTKAIFKKTRKAIVILGAAYHFCNTTSALPEEFVTFIVELGKVKDSFSTEKSNDSARSVINVLENHDLSTLDFDPTNTSDYQNRIDYFSNRAKTFLSKDELPINEYHLLRQELRYIMNIFRLAAGLDLQNLNRLQTYQYLGDLDSELGKVHDIYVQSGLKGMIEYGDESLVLPKEMKKRIENFYDKLQTN